MHLLDPDPAGLALATAHLRQGGIVAFPTETVYGLGAVVWDAAAIARVFEAKQRPLFDPLIAHVAEPAWLTRLWDVDATPPVVRERVRRLVEAHWPGPLTLVLPRRAEVPDLAAAGLPTVGVRMPDHPVALALIARVGHPLVAPSANRFGRVSPTTARAVVEELGDAVPYVLDGGPCRVGVESTVLGFDPDGAPVVLRPGGLPPEVLEATLGVRPTLAGRGRIEAPGQLESHYAPERAVTLLPGPLGPGALPPGRVAVLASTTPEGVVRALAGPETAVVAVEVLSEAGDAHEAARRLFSALRVLDRAEAPIVAEPWPDPVGLGLAIGDRLRRAAARRMGPSR